MTAPQLTAYVTGQGSVSGDQLNTFVSSCNTLTDLRAFVGTTGIQVYARGAAAPNDNGEGFYYWDPNAIGPDNNFTVIIPPAAASGGWVRLTGSNAGFFYAVDTGTVNALAVALPADLSGLPIGTVIFVNPGHTTTSSAPTLSVNGATGVPITDALGNPIFSGAIVQNVPAQIMVGTGGALWLLNPGGSVLGPYATAALGQLPGTNTNDDAGVGDIGEFMSQTGAGVGLVSNVTANVAVLPLTAGDWDVWGFVTFDPGATTGISIIAAGVSSTSFTFSAGPTTGSFNELAASFLGGGSQRLTTGQFRASLAAPASVYLLVQATFDTSTMTAGGFIAARRAR